MCVHGSVAYYDTYIHKYKARLVESPSSSLSSYSAFCIFRQCFPEFHFTPAIKTEIKNSHHIVHNDLDIPKRTKLSTTS